MLIDPSAPPRSRCQCETAVLDDEPKLPLARRFVVPYPRNPKFVRRRAILNRLPYLENAFEETQKSATSTNKTVLDGFGQHSDSSSTVHRRAALFGLAGMGKTEIAIEYAHLVHELHPEISVYWAGISEGGLSRFISPFNAMAQVCDIPGYNTNQCSGWVFRWLKDARNGPWVLIIDNVHESDKFPWMKDISDFESKLPRCSHGTIIFTTQSKITASKLLERNDSSVLLYAGPLPTNESVDLFKSHLDGNIGEDDESYLDSICHFLGGMPLSVTEIASYTNTERITLGVLWKWLQADPGIGGRWSNQDINMHMFDRSDAVLRWHKCIGQVRERCPLAGDLILLMSFFGTNPIPGTALLTYLCYRDEPDPQTQQKTVQENIKALFSFPKRLWKPTEPATDVSQGFLSFDDRFANRGHTWDAPYKPQLEEALKVLNDSCLLHINPDGSFRMYLQVQLSIQERLRHPRNLQSLLKLEAATTCLSALFPDISTLAERDNMLDHDDCKNLRHHFESLERNLIEMAPESRDAKLARASFHYKYGLYCLAYGLSNRHQSWDKVEEMFRTSAEIYREVLGEKHPRTLKSWHQAVLVQIENQKDIGARAELDRIRDLACDQSGAFPAALWADMMWGDRIMLNVTYRHYEYWVIAAREFVIALKEMSRLHGHDSDHVLRILQRMVVFYRLWVQSGEIDAITYVQSAFLSLDTSDIISGNDPFKAPRDALSIQALRQFSQNVYYHQPNSQDITKVPLGRVSVLWEWMRLAQAVFDRNKLRHGERHPDTLRSLTELAIAQSQQGWGGPGPGPLRLAETCYGLQSGVLGENHHDTLEAKRVCGELLHKMGRTEEAVQVLKECYEASVRTFQEASNLTLECAFSLAEAYLSVGRFGRPKDAEDLMERTVEVREADFEAKNDWKPHGVCCALELTSILQRRQREFGKAVETLERVLELCKYADPSYPAEHDKPREFEVKIEQSMAVCYFLDGKLEEAERLGLEVLKQRRKWEVDRIFHGANHVDTLWSLFLVALVRWNLGRGEEAKEALKQCLDGAKARLGAEHELFKQVSQWMQYVERSAEQGDEVRKEPDQETPEIEGKGGTPPPYVEFPCRRRAYRRL
ncbi:hypothetical protein QBC41DRAFT_376750 [Cercophora samala]|uniref:TPR-like protein n=1 Tax=Cercophora samala TaxID=330535 RepID=A0AA39Z1L9_9PEZI|nr:hypothetical protein QBC41DRAFT_376750 [Cercophora samala]